MESKKIKYKTEILGKAVPLDSLFLEDDFQTFEGEVHHIIGASEIYLDGPTNTPTHYDTFCISTGIMMSMPIDYVVYPVKLIITKG